MTDNNQDRSVLTNAIVWAALIIATALLTMDALGNQGMTLLLLQIAGWYTIDATLTRNRRSLKAEWACLRKRLAGRKA
jgi:hypothetical protein